MGDCRLSGRVRCLPKSGLAGFLAAGLLALAALPAEAQVPSDCTIARLAGEVTLIRQGVHSRLAAGDRLALADRVQTAAAAKAEIRCAGEVSIVVAESTRLDLATLATGAARGYLLELIDGLARFILPEGRPPGRFQVTTPSVVASVRSTEWLVQVQGPSSAVFVARGQVAVAGRAGGTALLGPGEGVDVAVGQPVGAPVRWGERRVQAVLRATTF